MKKIKNYIVFLLLLISFNNAFAQDEDPENPCGTPSVDCPLDTNIAFMLIAGTAIGFLGLRKRRIAE